MASAHKAKGRPVNMERVAVMMIQLYRSAAPFDSCECAGGRSFTMPCLSNHVNIVVLTYSPPLSVLNCLMLALSCVWRH